MQTDNRTAKNIRRGEELFLDYGDGYWINS